ncbi:hypothetical protein ACK8N7_01520 [Streptomyces griseobrunneus]
MAHEGWTVDRPHVTLPHSASRQQLLQDVNFTPIENLPVVLEGWARAAEQLGSGTSRRTSSVVLLLGHDTMTITVLSIAYAETT